MKITKQYGKYAVEGGGNLSVVVEIDYINKTFKINSLRKDGSFLFCGNNALRTIAIVELIIKATHYAANELYPPQTPKETIEAFTQ